MNLVRTQRILAATALTSVTAFTAVLAGCALTPPSAPTLMALPAKGKSLNEFQQDDYGCRTYASGIVDPMVQSKPGANGAAAAPVLGTLGGAAAGALIGAGAGNAAMGAEIGAGAGLLLGSAAGLNRQNQTEGSLQQQFDNAYAQCMTAHGDTIAPPPMPVMMQAPAVIYAPAPYYYVPY
ncbi:glycine zipper family protein [Paraburkholderia sp. BCC1886]|uniref:glycine zipper family protein n=1 Tax=Paraburkholderia sp. BCC1886 TaxID=2562670 RepID=UPI0021B48F92|nr:glycine zipper family protein [Paraburkholderia sp. BCC1886]